MPKTLFHPSINLPGEHELAQCFTGILVRVCTSLSALALSGCDGKLNLRHPTASAEVIRRALFDKARVEIFPNVRVRYMSSGTSPGMFLWPVWVLGKHAENVCHFADRVQKRQGMSSL